MISIYEPPKSEPVSKDMRMWAQGVAVPVLECYVSAYPFNRRWPGYQRSKDQAEVAYFVNFEADGPVQLQVAPTRSFSRADVRPKSRGIEPEVRGDHILFEVPGPGFYTAEFDGKSGALHIFVNPPKDYGVRKGDENTLYFGPGEHDVGLIEMKSGQCIYLDERAVVYGRIFAENARDLRILGRGIFDNSRIHAEILFEPKEAGKGDFAINNALRHHAIHFKDCQNIEVDGITIRDSQVYNIAPYNCDNFRVNNVKIIGCWRYNSDGIDMQGCRNCHVQNSFLRTYDDSVCVKGLDGTYPGKVEFTGDILVENLVIWNDWGKCLEIGAETKSDVMSNITFRNCDLIHLTGSAMDIFNVDHADVHDVLYEDIRVEYEEAYRHTQIQTSEEHTFDFTYHPHLPRLFDIGIAKHFEYSEGREERGKVRDITFKDISVSSKKMPPSIFAGYDKEHRVENVRVCNLMLEGERIVDTEKANFKYGDHADPVILE